MEMRDGFPYGECHLQIEPTEFRYQDYLAFLGAIQYEARIAQTRQQAAFAEERARWAAAGQAAPPDLAADMDAAPLADGAIPEGCQAVTSPVTSSVWKILVEPGQTVQAGESLLVLEAMKIEVTVTAPQAGVVEELRTQANALVMHGQNLVILRTG